MSLTSVGILHQISTHSSDDSPQANFEAQRLCLLFLSCCCRNNSCDILITTNFISCRKHQIKGRALSLPVGILVSNTVPSSRDPVYQQLTVSPFFGKFVLSPFFSTDLVYLGGPCEECRRIPKTKLTAKQNYLQTCWICTSSTASVLTSFGFSSNLAAFSCSVTSSTGSEPLNLWRRWMKWMIKTKHLLFQDFFSSNDPYFALKELIVGSDQLFFLCCFSHIFDVSQQLVLTEELREENRRQTTANTHSAAFYHSCPPAPHTGSSCSLLKCGADAAPG